MLILGAALLVLGIWALIQVATRKLRYLPDEQVGDCLTKSRRSGDGDDKAQSVCLLGVVDDGAALGSSNGGGIGGHSIISVPIFLGPPTAASSKLALELAAVLQARLSDSFGQANATLASVPFVIYRQDNSAPTCFLRIEVTVQPCPTPTLESEVLLLPWRCSLHPRAARIAPTLPSTSIIAIGTVWTTEHSSLLPKAIAAPLSGGKVVTPTTQLTSNWFKSTCYLEVLGVLGVEDWGTSAYGARSRYCLERQVLSGASRLQALTPEKSEVARDADRAGDMGVSVWAADSTSDGPFRHGEQRLVIEQSDAKFSTQSSRDGTAAIVHLQRSRSDRHRNTVNRNATLVPAIASTAHGPRSSRTVSDSTTIARVRKKKTEVLAAAHLVKKSREGRRKESSAYRRTPVRRPRSASSSSRSRSRRRRASRSCLKGSASLSPSPARYLSPPKSNPTTTAGSPSARRSWRSRLSKITHEVIASMDKAAMCSTPAPSPRTAAPPLADGNADEKADKKTRASREGSQKEDDVNDFATRNPFPADVTVRVSASKMRRSYRNTFARVLSDARNDAHKHEKEHTRNKRQPTDVARGTRARDASPKGREDSSAVCGSVSSRGYRSSHDGDGGRRGSIEEQRPSRTSREGSECGGSQGMVKDLAHVISAQYMRGHRYMKDTQGRGFSFIPQKY